MVVVAGFKPARNKNSEDFVTLWFVKFYVLVFGSHLEGGRGTPFGILNFR